MASIDVDTCDSAVRVVQVVELRAGMTFDEDVVSRSGQLLVAKGQDVTTALIQSLLRRLEERDVSEPIRVVVPH